MSDGYLLNKRAIELLREDHRRLRSLVYKNINLESKRRATGPRVVATGVAATSTKYPNYPGTGNTFPVTLQTWNFAESTGDQSITYNTSGKHVLARTYDGSYVPEGAHVVLDRQIGRPGRRWWIRPMYLSIPIRTQSTGIPARSGMTMGSATCDLLSTTNAGVLSIIGTKTIYNITDMSVGYCKVGKADPVMADDGSVIYIIDVESCNFVDLVEGNCPTDITQDGGITRWQWNGTYWVQLNMNCRTADGYMSIGPSTAGTMGEIREIACSKNGCCYESDMKTSPPGWQLQSWHGTCGMGDCSPPSYAPAYSGQRICLACS